MKKVFKIIEIVFIIGILGLFASCIISQLVAPESGYATWMGEHIWNIEKIKASLKSHLPVILNCLIIIVIIYCVCKAVRFIFKIQMKKSNRTKTVFTLLDGFVKYGCMIAICIFVLKACGVDTTALIASVGVLTLVVGLGAQSLIADIIAGMFIIFENEYNVGEVISVDGFRGTVTEIGIRSTKVLDAAGNIKIINNSNIGDIVNLSRELSLAIVDCDFPYDVPIEVLENLLKDNFDRIREDIPAIVEGPYYKGVCDYKDSNVTVRIVAQVKEDDRFQVERDLKREYRKLIKEKGIDISYPQVVLNYNETKDIKVTKKDKVTAQEFVEEQKVLSHDLDDQDK